MWVEYEDKPRPPHNLPERNTPEQLGIIARSPVVQTSLGYQVNFLDRLTIKLGNRAFVTR